MMQEGLQGYPLEQAVNDLQSNLVTLKMVTGRIFHPFPRLPIELRIKIWKHAAAIPQIIGLRDSYKNSGFVTAVSGCPLLQSCKEARQEVLKTRTPFYDVSLKAPTIYANLEIDTIWLMDIGGEDRIPFDPSRVSQLEDLKKGRFKDIRRLIMGYSLWCHEDHFPYFDFRYLFEYNLKEVVAVIKTAGTKERLEEQGGSYFIKPTGDWRDVLSVGDVRFNDRRVAKTWDDVEKNEQAWIEGYLDSELAEFRTLIRGRLSALS